MTDSPNFTARQRIEFLAMEHLRRRHFTTKRHPMGDGFHEFMYALDRLQQANEVLEFVRETRRDPYGTFSNIIQVLDDAREGIVYARRVLDETGFLELLDEHFDTLMAGLDPDGLPANESDILDMLGFPHLAATIRDETDLLASEWRNGTASGLQVAREFRQRPASGALDYAIEQIGRHRNELREVAQEHYEGSQTNQPVLERPARRRRWWKGLGQIVEGTAIAVADAGLAIGAFEFPVDAATRTYGAVISVTAGIGKVANGVGDLWGE